MSNLKRLLAVLAMLLLAGSLSVSGRNPLLTLDEFFDLVSYGGVEVSPDGLSVVIEVVRPDWQENRFRHELWLYRHASGGKGSLVQITRSGYEHNPQWSPDSRWIAFLSDQHVSGKREDSASNGSSENRETAPAFQVERSDGAIYLISADGGEPVRLT